MRLLFLAALAACGSQNTPDPASLGAASEEPAAEQRAPSEPSDQEATETSEVRGLCLPLVDGCGCSSMCARGQRHIQEDQYEITHAGQDSRLDQATRGRLCFDARGVSSPDDGSGCTDTFQWGACGGECIPTPVPTCRIVDGSCRRVDE